MTEQKTREIITPSSPGALIRHESGQVINTLIRRVGSPEAIRVAQSRSVRDTLISRPGLINEVLVAAYQEAVVHPVNPIASELGSIRRNYPGVIEFYRGEKFNEALDEFPVIGERVFAQRARLQSDPELAAQFGNTLDIEIALRLLIEDGAPRNTDPKKYYTICMSHEFFGKLAEPLIEGEYPGISIQEREGFTKIGSHLLGTRRMMELKLPENSKQEIARHADRFDDYKGRVRQVVTLQQIVDCFEQVDNPADKKIIMEYKKGVIDGIERLVDEFPDQIIELDREFPGAVTGIAIKRGWAVEFGSFGRRSFRSKDNRTENQDSGL